MIKNYGGRKLGVTSSHRRALLRNLATSLLLHERIETTLAKAKTLRPFAERIITRAKHGRHDLVRPDIHDRVVYKKLFDTLVPRYAQRPGGYTRILHLGVRPGDNAKRGLIELVN